MHFIGLLIGIIFLVVGFIFFFLFWSSVKDLNKDLKHRHIIFLTFANCGLMMGLTIIADLLLSIFLGI